MKFIRKHAEQAIWLLVVAVVIVAAFLIFPRVSSGLQAIPTDSSPSPQAASTSTPAAYPGPELSMQLTARAEVTQTPDGYPAPETPSTTVDYEATQAAMWAEATVSAQAPTPTPFLLVGPRTMFDSTGQYSLDLPEGWWGSSIAGTSLHNYDDDALEDVHKLPEGAVKVHIGVTPLDGRIITELLEHQKIVDRAGYDEVAPGSGDSLTFTEVQPLQLGPYPAFEYYMTTPEQIVIRYISFSHAERLIYVMISPANSPAQDKAMAEALSIILTIAFLP